MNSSVAGRIRGIYCFVVDFFFDVLWRITSKCVSTVFVLCNHVTRSQRDLDILMMFPFHLD
jgi:hypothetical protein